MITKHASFTKFTIHSYPSIDNSGNFKVLILYLMPVLSFLFGNLGTVSVIERLKAVKL